MTHVLLWDIDGTLLSTARAGVFALEEAAREVCGTSPDFSALRTSGLTDSEVASLAIRTVGAQDDPETVTRFLRTYERHLPDRLHYKQGRVLTRVAEVLEDVTRRPGVRSLLLTGNTRAGADAKLRHYGLDGYFDDGAFCMDGDDRPTIARRALAMAGDVPRENLFVIGDTPHDVRAGDAIGARTVVVATGVHPLDELQACGPWLALPELPEPARFAELLGLP